MLRREILQRDNTTVRSALTYFDTVSKTYSTLFDPLDANVQIMQNPYFKFAFLQIQDGQEGPLNIMEKNQMSGFLL